MGGGEQGTYPGIQPKGEIMDSYENIQKCLACKKYRCTDCLRHIPKPRIKRTEEEKKAIKRKWRARNKNHLSAYYQAKKEVKPSAVHAGRIGGNATS